MKRWLVLTVPSLVLLGGCAPSVEAGLANAPRLGDSAVADDRPHDVIANGGDSCGRYAERGPLVGRIPACGTPVHPVVRATLLPPAPGREEGVVVRWLQHFYLGWPCPRSPTAAAPKTVAWSAAVPVTAACQAP
jgi:hypothetical protein